VGAWDAVDTALKAYELVMPTLSLEVREPYYAGCRLLGTLFGIRLKRNLATGQHSERGSMKLLRPTGSP
jgi:hypothetical protein